MNTHAPADQDQRDHILHDLDTNILVEAAAGTGKTTSMVGRMLALLLEGKCKVETIAAVTFTKKSASELRERFHAELMRQARSKDASEEQRARLRYAVENIDQCFIGTIHSFCGRILRERPVEAGVDVAFEEIDEVADQRIQLEAWNTFVAELYICQDTLLDELATLGLEIGLLEEAFQKFVEYPDVDEWPTKTPESIEFEALTEAVEEYAERIRNFADRIPLKPGNDKFSIHLRDFKRAVTQQQTTDPVTLMQLLESLSKKPSLTQKPWGDHKQFAKDELETWEIFYEDILSPALAKWREQRYEVILQVLQRASKTYDKIRIGGGLLNFQDLLMKAADLLQTNPNVREYFKRRFTHLLVDEFQDTDPVQAKLMLLLTATDPHETEWESCVPKTGSLFVVGDPKQSIYRFRRADIVTYNRVKSIIQDTGGNILTLSANFRTSPEILDWVNEEFTGRFPTEANQHAPAYVPFHHGRTDEERGDFHGVLRLDIPDTVSKKPADSTKFEAEAIANTIAEALSNRKTVTRSTNDAAKGIGPEARPEDFMIVTRGKKNLTAYAQKLAALGIPHEVTGGTVLNETPEIALLYDLIKCLSDPVNPVALVNLLRGELFGFSDRILFDFRQQGGIFDFWSAMPENSREETTKPFRAVYNNLRDYATWLKHLPHVSALERIIEHTGLLALAASRESGNTRAGSLAKTIEIIRQEQGQYHDISSLAELLRQVAQGELEYDGITAGKPSSSVVRIMNLHKVKGLEAPVVFLADTKTEKNHEVRMHIDRSEPSITRGFMNICGPANAFGNAPPLLAHPHNWEEAQDKERPYENEEKVRLLYVAATRAGSAMVISNLIGSKRNHFWVPFKDALDRCPPHRAPDTALHLELAMEHADEREVSEFYAAYPNRIPALLTPTYQRVSAKSQALADSETRPSGTYSEQGAEWGTLIHNLLEAAMNNPDHDLRPFALSNLAALDLPASRCNEAIDTVQQVIQSVIWKRARNSNQLFTEIPFQYTETAKSAIPTLMRGVIDLVFEENGNWIIVDYKTDASAKNETSSLAEHYTPQLQAYARAWQHCTGNAPAECGLYFTAADTYVEIPKNSP